MDIDCKKLSLEKYTILTTILADKNNAKFFKEMDNMLITKRFDNAYELSLNENILNINSFDLTSNDVISVINSFIKISNNRNLVKKRNIYEIVKISNMPVEKLQRIFNEKKFLKLGEALINVSRETRFISFDFLALRIIDNFIIKYKNAVVLNSYQNIKKQILYKITHHSYDPEKKEKETNYLCWIDRLLYAAENKEILIDDYIKICEKVLNLINGNFIYTYWKILHAVNFLLLQQDFSTNANLRKFKRILISKINENYKEISLSQDELKKIAVSVLAKESSNKEDFYYLFDLISLTADKSIEDKVFCFKLCRYIIKQNSKQNIFCFRFIRKYFLETIFKIIRISDDFSVKEEELQTLISLLHVDAYFCFNRHDIINKIVLILRSMNNGDKKLTANNFYRYCHILDYIMVSNSDIKNPKIINDICATDSDKRRISKYFQLTLNSYAHAI